MKVFLSWSGSLSHKLACTFRDWLPLVLQHLQPYVSSEDIDKGARWLADIVKELETSYYGILFITNDNYNAPWLNFEAGALTKAVQKNRVTPFLFDIKMTDFAGPLTQFQGSTFEKLDIFKLLVSLNRASDDDEIIPEERLRKTFEIWWPELQKELSSLLTEHQQDRNRLEPTKEQRMLEEILETVRGHQVLLRSPEILFPQDYFEQLLHTSREVPLVDEGKLQNAIRTLERSVFQLSEEYRKIEDEIKGIPKTKLRTLERLIENMKEPLQLIIMAWNA